MADECATPPSLCPGCTIMPGHHNCLAKLMCEKSKALGTSKASAASCCPNLLLYAGPHAPTQKAIIEAKPTFLNSKSTVDVSKNAGLIKEVAQALGAACSLPPVAEGDYVKAEHYNSFASIIKSIREAIAKAGPNEFYPAELSFAAWAPTEQLLRLAFSTSSTADAYSEFLNAIKEIVKDEEVAKQFADAACIGNVTNPEGYKVYEGKVCLYDVEDSNTLYMLCINAYFLGKYCGLASANKFVDISYGVEPSKKHGDVISAEDWKKLYDATNTISITCPNVYPICLIPYKDVIHLKERVTDALAEAKSEEERRAILNLVVEMDITSIPPETANSIVQQWRVANGYDCDLDLVELYNKGSGVFRAMYDYIYDQLAIIYTKYTYYRDIFFEEPVGGYKDCLVYDSDYMKRFNDCGIPGTIIPDEIIVGELLMRDILEKHYNPSLYFGKAEFYAKIVDEAKIICKVINCNSCEVNKCISFDECVQRKLMRYKAIIGDKINDQLFILRFSVAGQPDLGYWYSTVKAICYKYRPTCVRCDLVKEFDNVGMVFAPNARHWVLSLNGKRLSDVMEYIQSASYYFFPPDGMCRPGRALYVDRDYATCVPFCTSNITNFDVVIPFGHIIFCLTCGGGLKEAYIVQKDKKKQKVVLTL